MGVSHCWGIADICIQSIDHFLYGIILRMLILSVRPGLRCTMWSVLQFLCHTRQLFFVYIYFLYIYSCKQYWKRVLMYFYLQFVRIFSIGKVSPYIFYWQSVPIYFLLAKSPHVFFIGKVSPYILCGKVSP
jgi:hypothetical protein